MSEYRFRLTGCPPDRAFKNIELADDYSVREAKEVVKLEYNLNKIIAIQFIHKGKVIPDDIQLSKTGIRPQKDVVSIMATQAGG